MSTSTRDKLMAGLAKRDKSMLADPHLNRIGNSVRKTGSVVSRERIFEIPISQISDNPFQYRDESSLNNSELESLSESIREHGLRSPIQLRKVGDNFQLVAGWRRLTSIKRYLPDVKTVNATVDNTMDDKTHRLLTIIENEQREDFTVFEKAKAYSDMQKMDNQTLDEIAKTVGSSKTRISRILKLLTLPDNMKELLRASILKGLSVGHLDELVSGYRKRETVGDKPKVIFSWVEDLIKSILAGEMTIAHLRENNKEIVKSKDNQKKPLKRWKINGGTWNKFEVSTRNKVTLEFKLPDNIQYNDSDSIKQYIGEQLLKLNKK